MPVLGRARPHGGAHYVPALLTPRNPGAMAQWSTALAGLNSAPATWLAIGGDMTEGQGASTRASRWIDQALTAIRSSKGAAGGVGWVSAAHRVTGTDSPWATTGVSYTAPTSIGTTKGVGYRFVALTASTGAVTFTVTGNLADLWYISESTSGSFTYQVDGGTAVPVTTAGPHDVIQISGIGLGAIGSHSVKVTATSGTVYITGLMVYSGDAGSGVHLYEASQVGATSSMFAGNLADTTDLATTIAPDLVTIELGSNDAGASIDSVVTRTNILSIIAMLRALPKVPSIALVISYYPVQSAFAGLGTVPLGTSPLGSGTSASGFGTEAFGTGPFGTGQAGTGISNAPWANYVSVLRRMAITDTNLGLVDLALAMPSATVSGTGLYSTDGIHPSDAGHAMVATQAATLINPTVTVISGGAGSSGRFLLLAGVA